MRKSANHYDEYSKNLHKEPSGLRGCSELKLKICAPFMRRGRS